MCVYIEREDYKVIISYIRINNSGVNKRELGVNESS